VTIAEQKLVKSKSHVYLVALVPWDSSSLVQKDHTHQHPINQPAWSANHNNNSNYRRHVTFHRKTIPKLRSVTCHMGSHSVTCHQTQMNAPHLNSSQYEIHPPREDRRLSSAWFWLYIEMVYALCSEKNTHSCFLVYLHGKCSDFHKIFRERLGENKCSIVEKVRYSLPLMTSCWRHISAFVNFGFYCWIQTVDKMFASQQSLWSHKFVQDVSG